MDGTYVTQKSFAVGGDKSDEEAQFKAFVCNFAMKFSYEMLT